jgi:hypothetical protein
VVFTRVLVSDRMRSAPLLHSHHLDDRLDDRFAAVGQIDICHAGRKSGGVFGAPCVKAAQPMLGSVVLDFGVIGYGLTILTVTEDHLIERLFKMEIPHVTTETTSGTRVGNRMWSLVNGNVSFRHPPHGRDLSS